jgi:hypothetical protein
MINQHISPELGKKKKKTLAGDMPNFAEASKLSGDRLTMPAVPKTEAKQ